MGLVFKEMQVGNGDMGMNVAYDGYAVTPNDTLATYSAQVPAQNGQPRMANALIATGTGNVNLVLDTFGNTAVVAVAAGNNILPMDFIQVKATSTTATGISALFRNC